MLRLAILFLGICAHAQTFDVASIKPARPSTTADGSSSSQIGRASRGRFKASNASLQFCITWAYHVKDYQVIGPAWLDAEGAGYDIEATTKPETTENEMRVMLQALLATRFGVKIHHESRTLPVYLLTIDKKGVKLKPAPAEADTSCNGQSGKEFVQFETTKATVPELAECLSFYVDRPVIDNTRLDGAYAVKIRWTREGDGPSVFTVLEQDLGLKLQAAKAPVDVLVVDHVEKSPTAN